MIDFEKIVPRKVYKILHNGEEISDLELVSPSSISNKFEESIADLIINMNKTLGQEFEDWFVNFFSDLNTHTCNYCKRFLSNSICAITSIDIKDINKKKKLPNFNKCELLSENELYRKQLIFENIEKIKYFVDKYLDILNLDFSIFVNEKKIKKTSIVFQGNEIEKIMRLSSYLKVYSLISNSENLKLDMRFHKEIFNFLLEGIDKEIIEKIFEIIRTKTFRYKQTDQFMWEYIKLIQCKEIDTYIVEIFNFLMNNIIVLCKLDKNPITYFVAVVDTAIVWILRSVYKASIIYSDETSDEIQTIKINNLMSYSYNDTLGRIKIAAYKFVYKKLEDVSVKTKIGVDYNNIITDFHNRMKEVRQESPLISFLVYPLLSTMTDVPYNYFKSMSFEQSLVLSSYLRSLLTRSFGKDHRYFFRLLDCYPDPSIHVPMTTTYLVKQVKEYINLYNNVRQFYGFDCCYFQNKIYSYLIGRLVRIKFKDIYTGESVMMIDQIKLERDIILFYTYFFSGAFEKGMFVRIRSDLSKLF